MIDALLKLAELFGKLIGAHGDRVDKASLAARDALTLAANYLVDLKAGQPHDRNAQKAIAIACSEAGSKLRRDFPDLAEEFFALANFWSSGAVAQPGFNINDLAIHVNKIEDLLVAKNLMVVE